MRFIISGAFYDKTVAYCNKEADVFCNKLLSHFVINFVVFCYNMSHFLIKCHKQQLLTPKI